MPLLNYTTTIDPTKTLAEIQRCLVAHGARGVMTLFDEQGRAEALIFAVATAFSDRQFRLPARIEAVYKTLELQHRKGKVPRRFVSREQAARVAWRIVKDWIEAQMAIVESGMTSLDEVMLPYMLGSGKQTVYEVMVERQLALPGPASP